MITCETKFIVRYAETDQMGIVHHSNYPVWFEAGRTDFIKKMGVPYSKIENDGLLLPLIELRCKYKGAARYEDEIIVKTSIKEFTITRISFHYEVYKNNENAIITEGETEHAWTTKLLKPINLKKCYPELYHLIQSVAVS